MEKDNTKESPKPPQRDFNLDKVPPFSLDDIPKDFNLEDRRRDFNL
jgi:hypothetical protein